MALIAVPLGGVLAFLVVRTDLPGVRWIEPLLLIPVFVSPMVLAFGYVVAAGPVGFYTVWATDLFGGAPWGIYSLTAIGRSSRCSHKRCTSEVRKIPFSSISTCVSPGGTVKLS